DRGARHEFACLRRRRRALRVLRRRRAARRRRRAGPAGRRPAAADRRGREGLPAPRQAVVRARSRPRAPGAAMSGGALRATLLTARAAGGVAVVELSGPERFTAAARLLGDGVAVDATPRLRWLWHAG